MGLAKRFTIGLSSKAAEELQRVARWKKQRFATFLAGILESYHQSPSFASLLRRSLEESDDSSNEFDDEADDENE